MAALPCELIFSTTVIPFVTCPNSEYVGFSCVAPPGTMMKNWLPLVLAPELAMATSPPVYFVGRFSLANW